MFLTRTLFILATLCLSTTLRGQYATPLLYTLPGREIPSIFTASTYTPGVYQNIEEFYNNAPSLQMEIKLVKHKASNRGWSGEGEYKLLVKDTTINEAALKNSWGICINDTLYVNASVYGQSVHVTRTAYGYAYSGYEKMLDIGRYCCWLGTALTARMSGQNVQGSLYILNHHNDSIIMLTKARLMDILAQDTELLKRYKAEMNPRHHTIQLKYIRLYNARHPE